MRVRALLIVWFGLLATAHADSVDELARRLRTDPDYKVRLSAALNLGKLHDRRSVAAFIGALSDPDKAVRGVSAAALSKLIDPSVSAELHKRAEAELIRLHESDPDPGVRGQAARSLDAVRKVVPLPPAPPPAPVVAAQPQFPQPQPRPQPGGRRPIFVQIGPLADPTRNAGPAIMATMRKTIGDSMRGAEPAIRLDWPGGTLPTWEDLKRERTKGFYVDASLASLTVRRGTPTQVSCDLSLLIATYPGRSMFAFVKGNADVTTYGQTGPAIETAKNDCVHAVLDELVVTSIVPTIRAKAKED